MGNCFLPTDILLPKNLDFTKWAVIACDQFTSDREYWDRVEHFVGDAHSTLRLVYPEIDLENDTENRINNIHDSMDKILNEQILTRYKDSYIYVERVLLDGSVRPGIVGAIDLEKYHYDPKQKPVIGATEQTVLERVPPRLAIRRAASMELAHVILFCNDNSFEIINSITNVKDQLPKLYDFDLMEQGGRITGYLVDGQYATDLSHKLQKYTESHRGETAFLVADGNHSLVTAKSWYEELKKQNPDTDLSAHPARYAMVELENIQDSSIHFEPIHRVIFETDPAKLIHDIEEICAPDGCEVQWIAGGARGTVKLDVPNGELPIAVIQRFLDRWLIENKGSIDYIHDADALLKFAQNENAIGFMMPVFDREALFAFGASGHILPRKTFSLGHSREKRYYLEGRKIK